MATSPLSEEISWQQSLSSARCHPLQTYVIGSEQSGTFGNTVGWSGAITQTMQAGSPPLKTECASFGMRTSHGLKRRQLKERSMLENGGLNSASN
jgi:hypothetical protein